MYIVQTKVHVHVHLSHIFLKFSIPLTTKQNIIKSFHLLFINLTTTENIQILSKTFEQFSFKAINNNLLLTIVFV